jgi:hypothetical protein
MKDLGVILLALAVVAIIFIAGPLVTIWSLNMLFPVLAIPYTAATWAAALWVTGILTGPILSFKSRK